MIYTCPGGELVDTETGLIVGYSDFQDFPPLSNDAQSLMRHFDGMSAEPLGSIPKIITLGRDEQRLLGRLYPYKFFKMGVRSDYLHMIDKINRHKMSLYLSIRMKNAWADPTSIWNSPEHRLKLAIAIKAGQSTPEAKQNMRLGQIRRFARPEERLKVSKSAITKFQKHPELKNQISYSVKKLWEDPEYREKTIMSMLTKRRTPEFREKMRNAQSHESRVEGAKKAWSRLSAKGRRRHIEAMKRGWAWKRVSAMFDMIFRVSTSI